jgi:transglutaminase-like putative cysteine protease
MSTRYTVTHRTEYGYEDVVTASYGLAYLLPRDVPGRQQALVGVVVEPPPVDQREHTDVYGNRALYFSVLAEHTKLVVTATSHVVVEPDALPLDGPPWESVRDLLGCSTDSATIDAVEFRLDSPLVQTSPALAAYASPSFPDSRAIVAGAVDLMRRIHDDFHYVPGTTSVSTTLAEVLAERRGVCQDFAHLIVGCLRSIGLAARYVSGYLQTLPPPGQPKRQGVDASHAWGSVFVPDHGWVDLDPTNALIVDDRYVITAWGRDYSDVAPLTGVIFTESKSRSLKVAVDVTAE